MGKEFKKYKRIERFGNEEVDGIELGLCYVFPKLDGTNSSVWVNEDGEIKAGSRYRELTLDNDNAGFYAHVLSDEKLKKFFSKHSNLRLYGEFLVPHSLRTYRDDAWGKFYVFDVTIEKDDTIQYVPYEDYKDLLDEFGIEYIPPIAKITNGTYESFIKVLESNNYLIKDGEGKGEGIVIKNYSFYNKYRRVCWAKIITSEFKEKHYKTMGCPEIKPKDMIEQKIIDEFLTEAFIEKEYSKIVHEQEGWTSKYIPMLLGRVFSELVKEETWNILKKFKNPKIDFRTLNTLAVSKIKEVKKDLF
jgi:hypothetical protein